MTSTISMTGDHGEDVRDDPDHDVGRLSGSSLVAARRRVVRAIRVEFDPHIDFAAALDELVDTASQGTGLPMPGVRLLSPSYSGKSTVAREYAARVNASARFPEGTLS